MMSGPPGLVAFVPADTPNTTMMSHNQIGRMMQQWGSPNGLTIGSPHSRVWKTMLILRGTKRTCPPTRVLSAMMMGPCHQMEKR